MLQQRWKIDDLPWGAFDPERVDPERLPVVKAASMVESGCPRHAAYLLNVFSDDPEFQQAAQRWALEEVQHGETLGRYSELADPDFSFRNANDRYEKGYHIDTSHSRSVRGSRTGELVARCMVEIATSSYYTALGAVSGDPLLKEICRKIATDEFRHYAMFYAHLKAYAKREKISRRERINAILSRLSEAEDDELSYAYYASNAPPELPYKRLSSIHAFETRALPLYSREIVAHAVALMFKACGFRPYSLSQKAASWLAWRRMEKKHREAKALL